MRVPFNRPTVGPKELNYVKTAIEAGHRHLSSGGSFAERCEAWLTNRIGCQSAVMTTSATTALEMQATLLNLAPGDEVIMPSFTFVTTATAFVLRGATPVFVDIRPDTLNLDETLVEAAVTPRTRAIVAVHYAGVACEMMRLTEIARRHQLVLLEDAAHALPASYKTQALGSIGAMAALSFHDSKNLHCGEGGALLINDPSYLPRARVIAEKGTNRRAFLNGEVDKYSWIDLGSSCQPSELNCAFLMAQFERADEITLQRKSTWQHYHEAFEPYEARGYVRRPVTPASCKSNAHIYYLLFERGDQRAAFISGLAAHDISAVFHYVPLHTSPAGQQYGRSMGPLPITDAAGSGLVRLPLWSDMGKTVDRVIDCATSVLDGIFHS